jgi:hypothetical protein
MSPDDIKDMDPAKTPAWNGDHPAEGEIGDHYEPTPEEITRLRAQGIGVGAEDLQLQQDPTGSPSEREFRDRINRETNEDEIQKVEPDRRDGRQ